MEGLGFKVRFEFYFVGSGNLLIKGDSTGL